MELRDLARIARRRWWLIALPALVALAYAVWSYTQTPTATGYSTVIRFTAAVPPENPEGYEDGALAPWTSSEYVVNALADWVRTSSYADEVAVVVSAEGESIPADAIRASIAADNERSIMTLFLSWSDAAQLEVLSEAATQVLSERAGEYFPQFGGSDVAVIALDDPVVTPQPPPISTQFDPVIRFVLGIVFGILLAAVVEYLDPTIRERRDLERLDLPILAEIPR